MASRMTFLSGKLMLHRSLLLIITNCEIIGGNITDVIYQLHSSTDPYISGAL